MRDQDLQSDSPDEILLNGSIIKPLQFGYTVSLLSIFSKGADRFSLLYRTFPNRLVH